MTNSSPDKVIHDKVLIPLHFHLVDFVKVGDQQKCSMYKLDVGWQKSIELCAEICNGVTTAFIYGTNERGGRGCGVGRASTTKGPCQCECESRAGKLVDCDTVKDRNFNMYKYI